MATADRGPEGGHPHSTAKIGGHPIHPMLVPFPIVCFIGVLITDVVFLNNHDAGWATASRYLLGVGIVMAALAAVAGLTDFMGDERIRGAAAVKHMLANVTAVVLEIVNFFIRLTSNDAIAGTGIILSAVVVLILVYSGWMGGELVFRYGIGVHDSTNH